MKPSILLVLVLLFPTIILNAQIKGIIVDSVSNKPLAYASVYLKNTRVGTFTNADGAFKLPISGVNDTLLIRYLGYKDKYVIISDSTTLLIKLDPAPFILSKVEVIHYDEKYLASIIHDCIVKKTYSGKTIDCKSFAKINTYQNDTILREAFEAFYNTEINEFRVKKNNFKNGLLLTSKYNNNKMFRTLDLFSVIIPRLRIYSKPLPNSTNYGEIQYIQKIEAQIKLGNPINSYYKSEITKDFTLTGLALDKKTLRINYYSKQDTSIFGFLIIDIDKNDLLEFSNNAFYTTELPFETDNSNYHIHNVKLNTHIIFNNNRPKLLNIKITFDYKNIKTQEVEKIKISAKQLLYDFGNKFSELQPNFVENYDDYTLLAITPIIPELWQNELVLLKTVSESAKTANMLGFNYNTSSLSVWDEKWELDWKKVTEIDPNKSKFPNKKFKLVKLNAFILLDYYKTVDAYIVKTSTVFDYTGFSISQQQKTDVMKALIEKYFERIHSISKNLLYELNTRPNLSEKKIIKLYKKTIREEKRIKKTFRKEQRRYLIKMMNKK
jgi:hypothetical protein